MRTHYIVLLALLVVGCVWGPPQPKVWTEEGSSLSHYKVLEIPPAQNETGKSFGFDVAAILTEHIRSKFRAKGFTVDPGTVQGEDVLVVKNSIVAYDPGSAAAGVIPGGGRAICIVRTALTDKMRGNLLGEMITSKSVSGSGGLLGGVNLMGADKWILDTVATGIVDELEQRIHQDRKKRN